MQVVDVQHHYRVYSAVQLHFVSDPIERHLQEMDKHGIDKAIISNQLPQAGYENEKLYRETNDELRALTREHSDRFIPVASLPLHDCKSALSELNRSYYTNEMQGVFLRPHKGRIDSEELWPLYAKIEELGIPIIFHPVCPEPRELYMKYNIIATVGFMFSTTLAVTWLIHTGLMDQYKKLKIVLPHLGGALPFLIGRINGTFDPSDEKLSKRPIEYFKEFYYDTVCYDQNALDYTCRLVGPSRLLYGTDYGCPGKNFVRPREQMEVIERLNISPSDKAKIFGENALSLFK